MQKDIDFVSVKNVASVIDNLIKDTEAYWGTLIPYQVDLNGSIVAYVNVKLDMK